MPDLSRAQLIEKLAAYRAALDEVLLGRRVAEVSYAGRTTKLAQAGDPAGELRREIFRLTALLGRGRPLRPIL